MSAEMVILSSSGLADLYLLVLEAFYAIDNIGGSVCEAVGDLIDCLGPVSLSVSVNDRASFASFLCS